MSTDTEQQANTKEPRRRRSNLLPALVLAAGMAAAAFLLRPSPPAPPEGAATTTTAAPAAGAVVALEPLTLNLHDGAFVRIGVAVALAEGVEAKEFEKKGQTNKMKDRIIFRVSQLSAGDISSAEGLQALKEGLAHDAEKLYHEEFHGLYLTDLVVQ
jgi:flagellar protein FliL